MNQNKYMFMSEWTSDWPVTPGWYWFYGYEFGKDSGTGMNLVPIKVMGPVKTSSGGKAYMYSALSHFIYLGEAVGLWTPMVEPELPELKS